MTKRKSKSISDSLKRDFQNVVNDFMTDTFGVLYLNMMYVDCTNASISNAFRKISNVEVENFLVRLDLSGIDHPTEIPELCEWLVYNHEENLAFIFLLRYFAFNDLDMFRAFKKCGVRRIIRIVDKFDIIRKTPDG